MAYIRSAKSITPFRFAAIVEEIEQLPTEKVAQFFIELIVEHKEDAHIMRHIAEVLNVDIKAKQKRYEVSSVNYKESQMIYDKMKYRKAKKNRPSLWEL